MNSFNPTMGAYDPPPRIMSFVGLESGGRGGGDRNEKQQHLWDWEPSVHPSSEIAHYYQFPPFFESAAIPNASFYDCAASSFPPLAAASSTTGGGCPLYSVVPGDYRGGPVKHEDDWGAGGIGLNLGHRMYFPTSDALGVERLFQRSTAIYQVSTHVPQCQVAGCKADLTRAKNYHRRHKVCEFHSKSAVVIIGGMHQRFCQQCSRFHVLSEFDETKRSCRKRLADHNRRRRKPRQPPPTSVATSNPPVLQDSRSAVGTSRNLDTRGLGLRQEGKLLDDRSCALSWS